LAEAQAVACAHVTSERDGVLAAVAAFVIWGLLTIYWKALEGFNAFELIAYRITCSAVVLALLLTWRRDWRPLQAAVASRQTCVRLALAAVLITVNWTCYVWAVVHDRVIETALGYFMGPLGYILIGVVVFREHLRTAQRAAVGLALVAVVVLTWSYGRVPILALLIMVSWSLYGLLKRQVPLSGIQSLGGETFLLVLPALAVILLRRPAADSVASSASTWQLVLVALSGVATAVPLLLFAFAAKRVRFTLLGPLNYIVPTINFLLGVFLYHEAVDATRLAGFSLVWVGLALVTVDNVVVARRAPATVDAASPVAAVRA
jgi:chloramphenicol-sensitive protein RarD